MQCVAPLLLNSLEKTVLAAITKKAIDPQVLRADCGNYIFSFYY